MVWLPPKVKPKFDFFLSLEPPPEALRNGSATPNDPFEGGSKAKPKFDFFLVWPQGVAEPPP